MVVCRNAVLNNVLDSRRHLGQGANMGRNYRITCSNDTEKRRMIAGVFLKKVSWGQRQAPIQPYA